jgi:hypothetical protein
MIGFKHFVIGSIIAVVIKVTKPLKTKSCGKKSGTDIAKNIVYFFI